MFVVIGDFILDEFQYGQVSRVSPEAPNLVLDLENVKKIRGGAYNVVEHLRNLDNKVHFVSLVGNKNVAESDFENFFDKDDIIIWDQNRLRTVKTRMVAKYRHTTLLRVDQEDRNEITTEQENLIIDNVQKIIDSGQCKAICIVDYCKGVITSGLAATVIKIAGINNIKTYVDTKSRDIKKYSGAFLLKPNKNEFSLIKSIFDTSESSDASFCDFIFKSFGIQYVLRTLGEAGLELYSEGIKSIEIEGHVCEVKELSGAGDSLLSATAHLHNQGLSLLASVEKANKAASIYVSNGADYRICLSDLN